MVNIDRLKEKYTEIYGVEACPVEALNFLEKELGLKVPDDFKEISRFYSGGLLGGISHYEIAGSEVATSIVQETLRLRGAIGLNKEYIVLAEPSESLIVLNVSGVPAVIWCDAIDAININSKSFETQPDCWDSYAEFFSYLLDREETE